MELARQAREGPRPPAAPFHPAFHDIRLIQSPRRDRSDGRISFRDATSRLSFMSWNPGGGARNLCSVINEVGNHSIAIQEARIDKLQAPFFGRRHPSSAAPAAPASRASKLKILHGNCTFDVELCLEVVISISKFI